MNSNSGWISVKDRLPRVKEPVLVLSKFGHVSDAALSADERFFDPYGFKVGTDVIYWMEMPEMPKAERERREANEGN